MDTKGVSLPPECPQVQLRDQVSSSRLLRRVVLDRNT